MAILSTVVGVIQCEVNYLYEGIPCQNVLAFKYLTGPITAPAVQALAEELQAAWATYIMPLTVGGLQLTDIYAKSLDFDYPYEFTQIAGNFGGMAGGGAPINAAILTTFVTGQIGRSFKGRTYLPGIPEGEVAARMIDASHQALVQAAYENVNANMFLLDYQHGVVSRVQGGVQIDPGAFTSVSFYFTSPIVADMGRRIDN